MGIENPVHLIFIAAVALIVLGPKRLPELARRLGDGVREFRAAIEAGSDPEEAPLEPLAAAQAGPAQVQTPAGVQPAEQAQASGTASPAAEAQTPAQAQVPRAAATEAEAQPEAPVQAQAPAVERAPAPE